MQASATADRSIHLFNPNRKRKDSLASDKPELQRDFVGAKRQRLLQPYHTGTTDAIANDPMAESENFLKVCQPASGLNIQQAIISSQSWPAPPASRTSVISKWTATSPPPRTPNSALLPSASPDWPPSQQAVSQALATQHLPTSKFLLRRCYDQYGWRNGDAVSYALTGRPAPGPVPVLSNTPMFTNKNPDPHCKDEIHVGDLPGYFREDLRCEFLNGNSNRDKPLLRICLEKFGWSKKDAIQYCVTGDPPSPRRNHRRDGSTRQKPVPRQKGNASQRKAIQTKRVSTQGPLSTQNSVSTQSVTVLERLLPIRVSQDELLVPNFLRQGRLLENVSGDPLPTQSASVNDDILQQTPYIVRPQNLPFGNNIESSTIANLPQAKISNRPEEATVRCWNGVPGESNKATVKLLGINPFSNGLEQCKISPALGGSTITAPQESLACRSRADLDQFWKTGDPSFFPMPEVTSHESAVVPVALSPPLSPVWQMQSNGPQAPPPPVESLCEDWSQLSTVEDLFQYDSAEKKAAEVHKVDKTEVSFEVLLPVPSEPFELGPLVTDLEVADTLHPLINTQEVYASHNSNADLTLDELFGSEGGEEDALQAVDLGLDLDLDLG